MGVKICLPKKIANITWPKAQNIYKKALRAGRWQNFAAGIGTGAAYSSLHCLHWHPPWVTTIEYVRQLNLLRSPQLSYNTVLHRLILFFINVTVFSINLILLSINILGASPFDIAHTHAHDVWCLIDLLVHLRKDIAEKRLIDPSTPLVAPLIVLDYGTICIGVMFYAHKLGASRTNSFQGLFWWVLKRSQATLAC